MSIVDSTSAGIYLLRTAQGETVIENTGPLTIRQSSGNGANQNIFFKTGASVGTEVTAITIDGSQRVGIGTTSPGATLDVAGAVSIRGSQQLRWYNSDTSALCWIQAESTSGGTNPAMRFGTSNGERARLDSSGRLLVARTSSTGSNEDIQDSKGGIRAIPQNAKTAAYTLAVSDVGKHISITTGGVTVPASVFSVGDAVSIYNNSASDQTITQGISVTLRLAGDGASGNKTLAGYGLATILCVASNTFVVAGGGLS
jgi:hypothetical protein